MNDFKNDWIDNKIVFYKQLELNLKEISTAENYPQHWLVFLDFVKSFQPSSILDIGCGCGIYYELCKKHLNIQYTGIDCSKHAAKLARETWCYDNFFTKEYKDLTAEYIQQFDLIHAGAMLDVLPNGDEALEFILSLSPKAFLIARIKLTDKPSYCETFTAYNDSILSYRFYHNKDNFLDLCSRYGYSVYQTLDNFYLRNK